MQITSSSNAIPANTANIPTESIKNDAVQRPQIPKPPATAENPASKHSTEFSEQNKAFFENLSLADKDKVKEQGENGKEQSKQDSDDRSEQSAENRNKQNTTRTEELDLEQLKQVQQLQTRDREVRTHEQAHSSVGGSLASAPNLNYTTGPDSKRYATSGDVSIDVSKVADDPAANIKKQEQVQRAALAPASPSSQDLKVAAQASSNINEAQSELNVQRLEEVNQTQEKVEDNESTLQDNKEAKTNSFLTSNESKQTSPLPSINSNTFINPVQAKRQAAQLDQKITSSGALDNTDNEIRLSITA